VREIGHAGMTCAPFMHNTTPYLFRGFCFFLGWACCTGMNDKAIRLGHFRTTTVASMFSTSVVSVIVTRQD